MRLAEKLLHRAGKGGAGGDVPSGGASGPGASRGTTGPAGGSSRAGAGGVLTFGDVASAREDVDGDGGGASNAARWSAGALGRVGSVKFAATREGAKFPTPARDDAPARAPRGRPHPDIPPDWTLKTHAKFTSTRPFAWVAAAAGARPAAAGLRAFTGATASTSADPRERVQRALCTYAYPADPLDPDAVRRLRQGGEKTRAWLERRWTIGPTRSSPRTDPSAWARARRFTSSTKIASCSSARRAWAAAAMVFDAAWAAAARPPVSGSPSRRTPIAGVSATRWTRRRCRTSSRARTGAEADESPPAEGASRNPVSRRVRRPGTGETWAARTDTAYRWRSGRRRIRRRRPGGRRRVPRWTAAGNPWHAFSGDGRREETPGERRVTLPRRGGGARTAVRDARGARGRSGRGDVRAEGRAAHLSADAVRGRVASPRQIETLARGRRVRAGHRGWGCRKGCR